MLPGWRVNALHLPRLAAKRRSGLLCLKDFRSHRIEGPIVMGDSGEEQALRQYLTSAGGFVHDGIKLLSDDPVKDRKVTARSDIASGTELLKVPVNTCFFASPTRSAQQGEGEGHDSVEAFLADQRKLTPFLRLVLTVLHESSKGPSSSKAAHIASMPKTHNCVLGWSHAEKSALAGTAIEAEAMTDIKSTFDRVVQPIIMERSDAWPGEWGSFAKFQLVCGLVQSRTFHLEENNWLTGSTSQGADLYIIPGIDMVNHSTDPALINTSLHKREVPVATSEAAEGASENGGTTAAFFTLESAADISNGSEILHTYGELSDGSLLNTFGFVDSMGTSFKNPNNLVYLSTEALVAWCQEQKSGRRLGKNFKRRKDFLRELDMLPDGFPITWEEPLPDNLITATQILLMSDMAEFDDLRLELQKLKKKKHSLEVLGKETLDESEHSMFVCTTLLRTIDEQISGFPEVNPPTEGADPHRLAQAAHIRDGEKELVQMQKKEILKLMMSLNSDAEEEVEGEMEEGPEEY